MAKAMLQLRVAALLGLLLLACPAASQTGVTPIPVPNAGFEEGEPGAPPPQWRGSTAAQAEYRAVTDAAGPHSGKASARLESTGATSDPTKYGVLAMGFDAAPYRGKRIRYSAWVRVRPGAGGTVGLWMRVDREGGGTGYFDNMSDRPIRAERWTSFSLEGDVAADAKGVAFGLVLAGGGAAWIDDVAVEVVGPARDPIGARAPGPQRPRTAPAAGDEAPRALGAKGLRNLEAFARAYGYVRYFNPSDEAAAADWNAVALAGVQRAEAARNPTELAAALNAVFQPVAPSFRAWPEEKAPKPDPALLAPPPPGAKAIRWRHRGAGRDPGQIYSSVREEVPAGEGSTSMLARLPGGVSAALDFTAMRAPDGRTVPHGSLPPVKPDKPDGFAPSGLDRATRLAAVVEAWNVFQHFYPYFDVVGGDWPAALSTTLRAAAEDKDDLAFADTLRRMMAALKDGHAGVAYPRPPSGLLPLAWEWVEGRLVVTAATPASGLARGDVVTRIGGIDTAAAIASREALFSGSPQWLRVRAVQDLLQGPVGTQVEIAAERDGGPRSLSLTYDQQSAVREAKPDPISQLEPGIFYVDLDRVTDDGLRARLADLAAARGVIFDLRGYPKPRPLFLSHLTDAPIRSPRFDTPVWTLPDRTRPQFDEGGWTLEPEAPRFPAAAIFITDGRAISYAESVLGTVAGNRLAEIVGEPTAGTNGNVTFTDLPGGYRLVWTAMRVTNRDGTVHHLRGVQPTIVAHRTVAGIRAGRDELLERALAAVKAKMPK